MLYRIRYEDENVRCVAQNIQCRIRFVIYVIVCEPWNIVCYIRHPMSNIRYKLWHRMSKHTISYDQRIKCRNTISYVLTNYIVTYNIVCQNIRYRMPCHHYKISYVSHTISYVGKNPDEGLVSEDLKRVGAHKPLGQKHTAWIRTGYLSLIKCNALTTEQRLQIRHIIIRNIAVYVVELQKNKIMPIFGWMID